jgi:hypothetical protein
MPSGVIDMDGCGDGDRGLQANGAWSGLSFSVSTSFGTFGGYGTQILSGGIASRAVVPSDFPIFGWHENVRIWNNAATGPEVHFREGSTVHAKLKFNSGGAIQILGAAGTVLDTLPSGTWPFQAWAYIEVRINVDNAGSFQIWLFGNTGDPDIEVSGDFQNGGDGIIDNILWAGGEGNTHWIDDWYEMDGNSYLQGLGGVVIGACTPVSDQVTDFVAIPTGDHFAQVDERPFDGSAYVVSDTSGHRDLYGISAPTPEYQIYAVRVVGQMRKNDAGGASGRLIIEDNSTQGSGTTRALSETAQVYADTFDAPPDTPSGDWDEATVAALWIGVERPA